MEISTVSDSARANDADAQAIAQQDASTANANIQRPPSSRRGFLGVTSVAVFYLGLPQVLFARTNRMPAREASVPWFASAARVKKLEERASAAEAQMKALVSQLDQIDAVVSETYRKLLRTGDLYTSVGEAKASAMDIRRMLDECLAATGSPNDIAAVREALVAVRKMLQRP